MRTARDHLFAHPGVIVCEHRIHKSKHSHAASFYSGEYHLAHKWQCEPWSAPVSCDHCNGLHTRDKYATILCAFSVESSESPPRALWASMCSMSGVAGVVQWREEYRRKD